MTPRDEPVSDRLARASGKQGDLATLDVETETQAGHLRRQMGGDFDNDQPRALPFIWGSIRILSVYGKWSWWKNPKRRAT